MSSGIDKREAVKRLEAEEAKFRRAGGQFEEASKRRHAAIAAAAAAGLSRREIARTIGLSHGRVQQIIEENAPTTRATSRGSTTGSRS